MTSSGSQRPRRAGPHKTGLNGALGLSPVRPWTTKEEEEGTAINYGEATAESSGSEVSVRGRRWHAHHKGETPAELQLWLEGGDAMCCTQRLAVV